LADELGSGVRRLHYYVPRYSGKSPELIDGDVFRIIVPLDDNFSYDIEMDKNLDKNSSKNKAQKTKLKSKLNKNDKNCALNESNILAYLKDNPYATQPEIAKAIGKSRTTVQTIIRMLKERNLLEREGAKLNGRWSVKLDFDKN